MKLGFLAMLLGALQTMMALMMIFIVVIIAKPGLLALVLGMLSVALGHRAHLNARCRLAAGRSS